MESLEEDLTCSVCYSLFSDPRVLPCSHTFCKGCLENVLQVSVNFSIWRPLRTPLKCPHCRNMVELPPTGVEALPTNVSLRAIIEKFQRDDQSKPPSCQEHPKQPLNVYCLQDRQLICGVCLTIGRHRGHAIDDLQAAFMKEQEAPGTLVEQLTDKRWAEVSLLAEKLEQQKAGCENLIRQDKESVVLYFEKIKRTLAQKEREFLAALDDAGAKLSSEYDPLLETLKDMKEEQLELMSYSAAVEEEDSPLLFLEKVHIFRERVAALSKAPLPVVKPLYIYPRAGEYLKHKWSGITLGNLEREEIPQINHCQGQVISRNFNRLQALYVSRSVLVLLLLLVLLGSALIGVQLSRYSDMYQINEMIQNYACEITAPFYSGKDVAVYFQSVLVDFITVSRSFFQL
ncbi:tripartite motif-containing protein 59 [Lepisosteus oculatus]|uniref:tripartite motif-containing protein 59 n=1 Tax=Lepisosteus oculatus TaxID=7918 RepID=UPI0007400DEA|nr:PREDICTED: tripartite motif-containing protein 59 [Lepisosteus oculatus]XP_015216452.1 PREDICTED: tripartite motif-containing protein 59 [Lepisosteus oculatus]XP_015216454.1 PREDICTED: tripartite motif-containing protein 59 [Lepisosteus oculatus]